MSEKSTRKRKAWQWGGLGLVSWTVLSLAACGWIIGLANVIGLDHAIEGVFPTVERIPPVLLSSALFTAFGLIPWLTNPFLQGKENN